MSERKDVERDIVRLRKIIAISESALKSPEGMMAASDRRWVGKQIELRRRRLSRLMDRLEALKPLRPRRPPR